MNEIMMIEYIFYFISFIAGLTKYFFKDIWLFALCT